MVRTNYLRWSIDSHIHCWTGQFAGGFLFECVMVKNWIIHGLYGFIIRIPE